MKKTLSLLLALVMAAALCACGAPAETPEAAPAAPLSSEAEAPAAPCSELRFVWQGVEIALFDEAEPLLETLGEAQASYVTESCAYPGNDYLYDYDGFELSVNEVEDTLRVTGISLLDDSVETPEGLRIGMPIEDALAAMPMDYQEAVRSYSFTSGDVCLTLRTNNGGEIVSIDYFPAA